MGKPTKIIEKRAKAKRLLPVPQEPQIECKSCFPENFVKETTNKSGRKSMYTDDILPRIEELLKSGLNNRQLAKAIGINETTIYDWIDRFPQFHHTLKKYRGLADIQVENALFKSALGFNFTEVKKERRKIGKDDDGKDKYELVVTEEIEKHIPGVSAAQIFYLKNRMPERYKDKIETQISLSDDVSSIAFALKRRGE